MARTVNAKGRRKRATFTALPHAVQDSAAFRSLSAAAVKLLIDILRGYNGRNNGNLACTYSQLRQRGWRSTATLSRAKDELLASGLIEQTRQGGLAQGRRIPSLFGVTWLAIDEVLDKRGRNALDVQPTRVPSGRWKDRA